MENLIKWGAIAAVIVLCLTLFASTPFYGFWGAASNVVDSFTTYATEFVNIAGSYFLYARKLLNNFLPADLVTITLALTLSRRPVFWLLETTSNTVRGLF